MTTGLSRRSDRADGAEGEPSATSAGFPQAVKRSSSRNERIAGAVAITAGAFLFILFGTEYSIQIANLFFIALIGGIALNLLLGVGGQLSLANAAFMGIGAVSAAALTGALVELPFLVVLVVAGLVAGIISLLVGLIALRLSGLSLVLGTLALHFITVWAIREYQTSQVGPTGFLMPRPTIFGFSIDSTERWFMLLALAAATTIIIAVNLLRTRSGRAWQLMRDRDLAAGVVGIDVVRSTLWLFFVTSVIIGVQGALFAYHSRVVTYEAFTVGLIVTYLAIVIIGGVGSIWGTVLGAAFVVVVPHLIREVLPYVPAWVPGAQRLEQNVFAVEQIVFGASIIAFMIFAPSGLAEIWGRVTRALRRLASGERAPHSPST